MIFFISLTTKGSTKSRMNVKKEVNLWVLNHNFLWGQLRQRLNEKSLCFFRCFQKNDTWNSSVYFKRNEKFFMSYVWNNHDIFIHSSLRCTLFQFIYINRNLAWDEVSFSLKILLSLLFFYKVFHDIYQIRNPELTKQNCQFYVNNIE